jgi:hypothetical protein
MEVNVGDVPQGFDMDEDNTHTYSPDAERFEDEEDEEPMHNQQPIYYEMPEYPKQQMNMGQESGGGLMNNINPLVWMVIVFVAFILGFFMGMGSGGGKGGQAPIILAPRGNM